MSEQSITDAEVIFFPRLGIIALLLLSITAVNAPAQISGDKSTARVDGDLWILVEEYQTYLASGIDAPFESDSPLVVIRDSLVLIDAVASTDGITLLAALKSIGLQGGAVWQRAVSGWLPILAIRQLDQLDELHSIRPSYRDGTSTGIGANDGAIGISSSSIFPNPFRDRASVRYTLMEDGPVKITVYDMVGREVLRVSEPFHTAGRYEIQLERSGLSQGVYVMLLEMPNGWETRPMTVVG